MGKKPLAVLAGLLLATAAAVAVPSSVALASNGSASDLSASDGSASNRSASDGSEQRRCAAEFDAAVHEDNDAYAAKDAARYEAILNPRMIFWYDGAVTYGRDEIMATARANFAVPGWIWTYSIASETVYDCHSGIAVLEAHTIKPGQNYDHHFAVTMQLVREHGKWSVAIDNVHLLPA